jgi:transcription initiation factor TFIIIB Brf1 subunit/transcription initiation factor TFIIB
VCTAHNVKVSTIDLGKDILYHFLSESTKRHRGMINGGIYSACLYLAYRNQGQYVSYKHTSAMFLIKKRFSTIGYKELEAVPIVKRLFIDTVDEMTITDCVKKYVIMLGLSEPMQKEVYRIANVIDANDLLETCNTISIVAACIAFKSVEFNLGITHSRIAAFMGLHPVTIENILITLLQNHVDLMI